MKHQKRLVAVFVMAAATLGSIAGPALASHIGSRHPNTTANTVANTKHSVPNQLSPNQANGGQATIRYQDRALSGWRTPYGIDNNNLYAPNSLELTRQGGSTSTATCASTGGHTPHGEFLTRCIDMYSFSPSGGANVAEYCGPHCGPFIDGSYTGAGEYKIVMNNNAGSATAIGNENIVAHEVGHSVGFDHHEAQEYNSANGRWYPGVIGEWEWELFKYFDDFYYDFPNQKHVLNTLEKEALNQRYGYSTSP